MDLLNRRSSTASSRRGTLLPGGARRNAVGGGIATASATNPRDASGASSPAKTQLLAEFRAHEEDVAARVLQRAARGFLGRRFVAALLLQVFRRQYDPIEKKYFYVNTATNETTWAKPRALRMFLGENQDVPVLATGHAELPAGEAARRVQRAVRAFLAKRLMQRLVRENYMKLFDDAASTFVYLNTRTGERSAAKPLFLGKRDATTPSDDIPVETFLFRRAVCKVASATNLYGSGVLGLFGHAASRWLCLLGDAKTLPDAGVAVTAHAVCNFSDDRGAVSFEVALRPERFFASVPVAVGGTAVPRFALCAVDRDGFFARAGANFEPLKLELNDRKMGCAAAASVRRGDAVEIVGHPHGKPRVVHRRAVAKLLPHSIAPVQIEYDAEMESGAAGCAVFSRGGKLLGLQHFTPLHEPPPRAFYCIGAILDAAHRLVTPPEPFLLTTRLASHEVQACWSVVRWFKPLPGLAIEFELELCHHAAANAAASSTRGSYDAFECVYRGPRRSKHLGGLRSGALYSLRVRARNAVARSPWSHALQFLTPPPPSLAWRIARYSTSVRDACARMRREAHDANAQRSGVQWLARLLDQKQQQTATAEDAESVELAAVEADFVECHALEWLLETVVERFPGDARLTLLVLRVATTLAQLQRRTQRLLSRVATMETILALLRRHLPPATTATATATATAPPVDDAEDEQDGEREGDAMRIPLACVVLLGAVLDGGNASAQQAAQALEIVPALLALLAADDNALLRGHAPFVADCAFLFARYTHNHTHSGKWQLVERGRLRVLRDVLAVYAASSASAAVYWTLITLGNVAYGCGDAARAGLEAETDALALVMAVCDARMQFLLRVNELELAAAAAQREFARLAASVMGDEMRNELDACEHEIATLSRAIDDARAQGDVALAGDFALRYLLTESQRRVQLASQRLMKKFLLRASAAAFAQWRGATVVARHCAVFRAFLTTVRHRQLGAAFRQWERVMREWRRRQRASLTAQAGLALDLNRTRREKYRMLVLQK